MWNRAFYLFQVIDILCGFHSDLEKFKNSPHDVDDCGGDFSGGEDVTNMSVGVLEH